MTVVPFDLADINTIVGVYDVKLPVPATRSTEGNVDVLAVG